MQPFDLGNNIGQPILDGTMSEELKEGIAKIRETAKENNKSSGIYSVSGDQARGFADQGFNMVSRMSFSPSLNRLNLKFRFNVFLDFCHDRHGGAPPRNDCCVNSRKRVLRPFSPEHGKRGHVRAIEHGFGPIASP